MREFEAGRPEYHIDIQCLKTGQRLFVGCHDGPIAPLLAGEILERAKITDAGKRLTAKQKGAAYGDYRNRP